MPRKSKLGLDQRAQLKLNPVLGGEYITLSRQDICEREINSAIRLVFSHDDFISAYLLVSAANEIMEVLSNGVPGVGLNSLRQTLNSISVSDDLEEEVFQAIRHPYNFLKHSSSDLKVENTFSVDFIFMMIFIAIEGYRILFGSLTKEMTVMYGVIRSWRVHWWRNADGYDENLRLAEVIGLVGATRAKACQYGHDMLVHVSNQK